MKKYLSILLVLLLCAFLFISCDELDQAIGEIIGGEGDEVVYDYTNGGGGTVGTFAGVWKGTSQVFGDTPAEVFDCDFTVTMDADCNITINEVVKSTQEVRNTVSGTYTLDDTMIKIEKAAPKTESIMLPWVSIAIPAGQTVRVKEAVNKEDFAIPEDDEDSLGPGTDYTVDGNALSYSYSFSLFGEITSRTDTFDFDKTNYTALKANDNFYKRDIKTEQVEDGDNLITIEEKNRIVIATVDEIETDESTVVFKYSEYLCQSDVLALWYKYDSKSGSLLLYWNGDQITLTKQQ